MEKDGIVLVMNIDEKYFQRLFGILLRFLKGKTFLAGTHILKHRTLKFILIRFDTRPDFKSFRIIMAFLKNAKPGRRKPDVRGFWRAGHSDPEFPEALHGKRIMLYSPDNTSNLNILRIVSEDSIAYSMDTSRETELIPDPKPEKEYLNIDLNASDFDPLHFNPNANVLTLLSDVPKIFRIALYAFIIFFAGMMLLTIILSFF
jgi:hypothetical protein